MSRRGTISRPETVPEGTPTHKSIEAIADVYAFLVQALNMKPDLN